MRVVVDRDRCEGNAVCVRIAPECSPSTMTNTPWSPPIPYLVAQETLAEQAIAQCPRAALSRND